MDVEFAGVSEAERELAIGTLVLAFTADPFVRWIYPEASQYLSRFPEALQAFGGVAFGQGGVWRLGDFAAVALWLPPGIEPGGDATVALFQATVDSRKFNDLIPSACLLALAGCGNRGRSSHTHPGQLACPAASVPRLDSHLMYVRLPRSLP